MMEKYNSNNRNDEGLKQPNADSLDLEQMREQLGILKQKLDKQAIVTDTLIHQAMKQKMSWITKYCWFAALVAFPFICIGWWEIKDMWGISIYSYLLLVILTGGSIVADIVINKMKPEDWRNENLVETAKKLAKMKHTRKVQVRIQMPLLVLVLVVLGYDAYQSGVVSHDRLMYYGFSCLVGGVVGGLIGLRILAKMQRTNDEIIEQIESLS